MSKVAIVYWSGTGNTEQMAQQVQAGAESASAEDVLLSSEELTDENIEEFAAEPIGCPSMGTEQLEESEFDPMFQDCRAKLAGKKIGLFGSYGWGDGQWMRDWEEMCKEDGAVLAAEPVICQDAPDDAAAEDCQALGKALA